MAFLKVGVELLKPGGYGLYVLPHSFLIAESASKLRKFIFDNCWIRCLAELSAIPVFGDTGIYVILFIFQKKIKTNLNEPKATIIKCRDFVGKALQDGIKNNYVDNPFYSIFPVTQSFFLDESWNILPYKELNLKSKISTHPKISDFLEVRQGFVTGADDVFIIRKADIPQGEELIYVPYLPDKKIDRYASIKNSTEFLIFPFDGGKKLEEGEVKKRFPETWKYLKSKESYLKKKKSVGDSKDWWRPRRTRKPNHLLSPKIVTPHLSIVPKFSLDVSGKFAVSRSPFLIPKDSSKIEMLYYFLAVLNSTPCYWYISSHSHKYSGGYTMIEVKTLQNTPVPDPAKIPSNTFKAILELVKKRQKSSSTEGIMIEKEIDLLVCELYNLNEEDRLVLQMT